MRPVGHVAAIALTAALAAGTTACRWDPPPIIPQAVAGCYRVELHGWTAAHEARVGRTIPRHVRLETVDQGRRTRLYPRERDWSIDWEWAPADAASADSLRLWWRPDRPGADPGIRLAVPAEGRDGWGPVVLTPPGYGDDLAPVRARLRREACEAG